MVTRKKEWTEWKLSEPNYNFDPLNSKNAYDKLRGKIDAIRTSIRKNFNPTQKKQQKKQHKKKQHKKKQQKKKRKVKLSRNTKNILYDENENSLGELIPDKMIIMP